MKCHLVNVVDNFHILITEAQYLGLKLFKKQFHGDLMVERQWERWFKHGQSVKISEEDYIQLSGLTYFGPCAKEGRTLQHHIETAINMVKTSAGKRTRPKDKADQDTRVKRPKRVGPKSRKRTLESEVELALNTTSHKRQNIGVVDKVPVKTKDSPSDAEMKERLIVTADNGNYMGALVTWLMGTYSGHLLHKTGLRNLYDIAMGGSVFTMQNARDFFLSPWEYHPDARAQIMEVINVIKPMHDKVVEALGNVPTNNVLHGISSQDFYKIIVKGSGTNLSNGMKSTSEMRGEIVRLLKKTNNMELLRVTGMKGRWALNRMNPKRVTNMMKVYLHFDPSNLLTTMGSMLTEAMSYEYLGKIYSDFTPEFIQKSVGKMVNQNDDIKKLLNARMMIGDQKSDVLRQKLIASLSGFMISTVGSLITAIKTAKNIAEVSAQLNNKRKGKESKVARALVKTLIDADELYNLGHMLMITAMEATACGVSVNSGLVLSSFGGPTSMTQYLGTMALKQLTQDGVRKMVGMEESGYLKAARVVANTPSIAANISKSLIRGTFKVSERVGKNMFRVAGHKRPRVEEIEDAIKKHKKSIDMKDYTTAAKIQNNYWGNRHFRNTIMSSMAI